MNRASLPIGFTVAVFAVLAAISILVTNVILTATESDRPTVTFSIVSASPGSQSQP